MISELFHLGPLSISPFGLMMMIAFLGAYAQLSNGLRRLGIGDADTASSIVVGGGIAGLLGAKIYYVALYRDWGLLFERAGFVWYGGVIGATAAIIWTIRRRGLPLWPAADAVAPAGALGYGLGRIGCFLVGDDYGSPTDLPWGVAFPVGLPPTRAGWLESEFGIPIPDGVQPDELLRVHPTQLYETAAALVIWLVGRRLLGRSRPGTTALVVFGLMATERFAVEFLRAKDDRFFGPFTLAQMISVLVLVVLIALAARRRKS